MSNVTNPITGVLDYRQLPDYNPTQWLAKNKAVNAPIKSSNTFHLSEDRLWDKRWSSHATNETNKLNFVW